MCSFHLRSIERIYGTAGRAEAAQYVAYVAVQYKKAAKGGRVSILDPFQPSACSPRGRRTRREG